MNEEYLVSIKDKELIMPPELKEIKVARIYSIPLTIIVIICAIISLITNIKRKSKIRIILSIIFAVLAIIIKYLLDKTVRNFIFSYYKESISTSNFFLMGTLIIILISLIVMIFKRKKENK